MRILIFAILSLCPLICSAEEIIYNTAFIRRVEVGYTPNTTIVEVVDNQNSSYRINVKEPFEQVWAKLEKNRRFIKLDRINTTPRLPR